MNHHLLLAASLLAATPLFAQKPMKAPAGGKAISNELVGIFFEDINFAADGGLYADLIQNGAFEYSPNERDGWGPGTCWTTQRPGHSLGYVTALQADPVHPNNLNYLRLHIERTREFYDFDGWRGFGIENHGYNGITLKAGAKYDFSAFFRNPDKKAKQMRLSLIEPGKEVKILADTLLEVNSNSWQKLECVLEAKEDSKNASLRILFLTPGEVDVDVVSLMPEDTFKGHGLRQDLAQALADLNPKFLRFPGGCVVHGGGDGFWNTYRWKTTVGPKETRRPLKNTWGYHQSMGLGYYEYFQFCEDLGMAPVPILPCGVSCQGTNGGWGMKGQAQDVVPMSEMDEWVEDALDLIEWANGPADSKWGKVRAEAGHPEPFGLKYLGIGNEERISPEFSERFKYMYEKITKAHPEILIVGTAGPGSHPGNYDYDNAWKLAEELEMPIMDEHYYERREYFLTSKQYDSYPRDRKTKVYLGEYSVQERGHGNQWGDALAEALYLMHVERNADIVVMTSYAPLLSYRHNTNWNPDLIYFDNEKPFLTCSYYVQQIFGQSSGDQYYGDCVKFSEESDKLGQSVVLNTKTRQLFVKYCNVGDSDVTAQLDLSRFGVKAKAVRTYISGAMDAENNYDQHPIFPAVEPIKASKKMNVEVPAHSLTMLTISL